MMMGMTMEREVKRGRPCKVPDCETFSALYEKMSNKEIAECLGMTVNAVQKAARRYGLQKTAWGRPSVKPNAKVLNTLFATKKTVEIADMFNVCPATVRIWKKSLKNAALLEIA